jgi:AraC-like DNA-binding protein
MIDMSSFNFTIYEAPDILKRDVICIRAIKHRGQDASIAKTIPSAFPGIVFQIKNNQSVIEKIVTRHAVIENLPTFFLHGVGSEPSTMYFSEGAYTIFQVVFKPQALYAVFGLGSKAMQGGILLASEIGAEALFEVLLTAKSEDECVKLMFQFLTNKLADNGQRDILVERSLDYIHQNVGSVTVGELCKALNISERSLEKRFSDVVGIPAQTYIRVKRVNKAIYLMSTGKYERLVDVVTELNFYDQSHFIRDIKALSWLSPKSLTQQVKDFQLDQTGYSYS